MLASHQSRLLNFIAAAIDLFLGILVVVAVTFCTALFGIVKPRTEWWALLIGGGIAILLALRILGVEKSSLFPRTTPFVPIVIFLALAIVQLVPLPMEIVKAISPETVADKVNLLADLPGSAQHLHYLTLSYYPLGTMHMLRIVLLDVVVFLAVLAIARTPRRIIALLISLSVVAALLAGLALAQDWSHASNIYWMNGLDTQAYAGPFVSHSDFAQQMNQFIGVVIAVILLIAASPWPANSVGRIWRSSALVVAGSVVIAGIIAIMLAESRSGTVCAVLGAAFVVGALASQRGVRTLVSLVVVLGCLILTAALFCGFDSIYQHVSTLKKANEYSLRIHNASDILGIFKHYPLVGVGLGSHQYFFPRYETADSTGLSTHAENEYAQILEETGLAGLSCVLTFAVIVWVAAKRAITTPHPIGIAAIGLGYGLVAVETQSFSDFGQHLPALGCLTAIVCALMIRLSQAGDAAKVEPRTTPIIGRTVAVVLLLAAFAWALGGADASRRADEQYQFASALENAMEDQPWYRTPHQNRKLIHEIQSAVEQEPGNIEYQLWLGVWRYKALVTPRGSGNPDEPPAASTASDFIDRAPDLEPYRQIVSDLNQARWSCPTFGPLYTFVGQLELDPLHDPMGLRNIRLGAALAPHDEVSLNEAATTEAQVGLWANAQRIFAQLLSLYPDRSTDVISFYADTLHRPDLALAIKPDDYHYQLQVINITTDPSVGKAAVARATNILASACSTAHPTAEELATYAQLRAKAGAQSAAVDLYRQAIQADYGRVDWHLRLAQLLLHLGRRDEAVSEATICLHLQPGFSPAQHIINTATSR
jgi:tetratricopeptide (TPR) repeat protein